jgi:hypothetical protein
MAIETRVQDQTIHITRYPIAGDADSRCESFLAKLSEVSRELWVIHNPRLD